MYMEETLLEIKSALETLTERINKLELTESKEILDNQDVMQMLNISSRTLQNYRDHGIITYSKLGGKIFYSRSNIEQLIEKNTVKQ